MYQKAAPSLILRITALLALFFASTTAMAASEGTAARYQPVEPTSDQAHASLRIVNQLQHHHFRDMELDDAFSQRLLNEYIDALDPAHRVFLATDIAEFQRYAPRLDDALQQGDLEPAFHIFNIYQQRRIEHLRYLLSLLESGINELDFDTDATLRLDREDAPWPESEAAMRTLWRKQLKNEVLQLRLDGQSDEEVRETLSKRYDSQLARLLQTESRDAFQAYMSAYTHTYDPHTQYFPPTASESFDIHMRLSLQGIGAVLQSEFNTVEIVRLVPGGPAARSGQLQAADRIVAVGQDKDGPMVDVVGMRLDEVVEMIRGPKGSIVRLKIIPASAGERAHRTRIVTLERDEVKLKDREAKQEIIEIERDGETYRIGVITLPTFYIDFRALQAGDPNYRSSSRDVRRIIGELKAANVDGIILDLRNNGGGALQEAIELTGLFIDTGPVVQIRDARNRVSIIGDRESGMAWSGPLLVLINRLSASASEIVAGALQDYGRALMVGSQTFGKGTVQTLMPLEDGQVKLTEAMFYRVSGASTQARGVIPEIEFPPVYDPEEIGESALPNALPWDRIAPAQYSASDRLEGALPALREQHRARVANDPDFQYLKDELALFDRIQDRDTISLNQDERRALRQRLDEQRLALSNRHRTAKGKEPFDSIEALEESGEDIAAEMTGTDGPAADDNKKDEPDPFLQESANLLVDLMERQRGG